MSIDSPTRQLPPSQDCAQLKEVFTLLLKPPQSRVGAEWMFGTAPFPASRHGEMEAQNPRSMISHQERILPTSLTQTYRVAEDTTSRKPPV